MTPPQSIQPIIPPILKPTGVTALPAIALDPAGRIAVDVACRKCGYNLRGLLPDGRCPECGTAVGRSLHGDLLRFSDPEWVQKLASGMNWIVAAIIIGLLGGLTVGCVAAALGALVGGSKLFIYLPLFGYVTGAVGLVGYWKVTTPDPAKLDDEKPITARKLIRIVQTATYVASPIQTFVQFIAPLMVIPLTAVNGLAGLVGNFALFVYGAQLARRIPDDKLVRHCRIVMFGMAIGLLASAVVAIAAPLATAAFATAAATSGPVIATTLPTPSKTVTSPISTGAATTAPAAPPSLLGMVVFTIASVVAGIVLLVFGIWALRILLKFRRALSDAADIAKRTWAIQPIAGPRAP
ncbi:MAG TPA: hypothetical protein VJZ71_14015 [Phycisphaerae bacterium]|nr:hypothetical protein [Phycisphaerae bacterium]